MTIGDLLRTAGVISPEQLQTALEYQKADGSSVAHALVTLGFVSDEELAKLVSRLSGTSWIDLEHLEIDPAVIRTIPGETARKYQVVPTALTGRVLTLAMADPRNVLAVDDIAFITGCNVQQAVASESALKAAIDRYYGSRSSAPRTPETVPGVDGLAPSESASGQSHASSPQTAARPVEAAAPAFLHLPTRAVWSLVAANVAIFGLELLWGGGSTQFALHRMGAVLGRAALAREPWRAVSGAFLHVNVIHLAFNMWALVVLGRMLEIMLGARRFIVLYGLSALGGGLASSLVHPHILSAGASGAVWGLMTALIVLLVRLKRLHGPEAMPLPVKTLLKPLVINLLLSLLPFVDLSAHLGGGAVGAGLILSGLMWGPRPSAGWRPAAWAASIVMAGCVVVALAHGRPWELRWPPPLEPRAIAGTAVVVPVPRGFGAWPGRDEGVTVFGDPAADPVVVYCRVRRRGAALSEGRRPEYLARVAGDWAARPLDEGESWESPPRVVHLTARPAVSLAFRYPSRSINRVWVMVEGGWWVQLEVSVAPIAPETWEKLPFAVADGIVVLGPSLSDDDSEQACPVE